MVNDTYDIFSEYTPHKEIHLGKMLMVSFGVLHPLTKDFVEENKNNKMQENLTNMEIKKPSRREDLKRFNLHKPILARKKRPKSLKGLEKVTEFLEIVMNSGYIKGEKPVSVLVIAPVSNGKTTAVKQFYANKSVKPMSDLTAFGVLSSYEKELREGEIRHIIVPDFLNALARKKVTKDALILFINMTSEDGIAESKTFAYEVKNPIQPFGWVLCVTKEAYERQKRFFDSIGFSSRFIKIQYKYSLDTISEILSNIIKDEKIDIPKVHLRCHKDKKFIQGNEKIFEKMSVYAKFMTKDKEAEMLRLQKNLQILLKSCAYTRGGF